jgi:hypothetical protein
MLAALAAAKTDPVPEAAAAQIAASAASLPHVNLQLLDFIVRCPS